ncbi:MAG: LPS assembly protein LptD [Holosporaceae bacterium]|nr:LPS assembly protein LptD [Holosporaceae bacterium]
MKYLPLFSCLLVWKFVGNCGEITFINSDETLYRKNHVFCKGNVIAVYDNKIMAADEISFDKIDGVVTAKGNVILRDEKGNIYFMDIIQVQRNFASGTGKNLKILTPDKSRLAAEDCRIKDAKFEMDNAVYTPCHEPCCGGELTWRLKSRHVVFDPDEYISYDDVFFEFLGSDVGYFPYFSHASPKLKRKSGFLAPNFFVSGKCGISISPKYLFAISPSQELILKPIITSKIGSVAWAYYGQRIKNGEFNIDASITGSTSVKKYDALTAQEQKNVDKIKSSGYRGHLFSKMKYEINDIWRCGFNLNLASDYYYLNRFPFLEHGNRTLESNVLLEGFDGRNYTQIKAMTFLGQPTFGSPKVLPLLEHNFSATLFSGTFAVDLMSINLMLRDARSARKIVTNFSWHKIFLLMSGHIIDINAITSFKLINVSEKTHSDYNSAIRSTPQLSIIWKWPLVIDANFAHTIVTPMIGFIAASNKKYIDLFEDPCSGINDLNFIDGNKSISPYAIDSGSRVCYGLRMSAYRRGEPIYSLVIGRSTELTSVAKKLDDLGMVHKNSNIVSAGEFFISPKLSLVANISHSTKENSLSRFDSGLRFRGDDFYFDTFAFRGNYCYYGSFMENISNEAAIKKTKKYKGLMINLGWNTTKNTCLKSEFVFGDEKNKLIRQNIGFEYKNECLQCRVSLERTRYSAGDLRPDMAFRIEVHLKGIGI